MAPRVKAKKPSYRQLKKLLNWYQERDKLQQKQLAERWDLICNLRKEITARVDTTMIKERQMLARAISELLQPIGQAIHVVIGKEVM
jgi:hypothetical protein